MWKPRASPIVKSIGDLRPAPTIREIPFEVLIAVSRLILLGSNSFFFPIGDEEREPEVLSLEQDRERDIVSRSACFNDDPRGNEEVFPKLVAVVLDEVGCPTLSLPYRGPGSDMVVAEDGIGDSSP